MQATKINIRLSCLVTAHSPLKYQGTEATGSRQGDRLHSGYRSAVPSGLVVHTLPPLRIQNTSGTGCSLVFVLQSSEEKGKKQRDWEKKQPYQEHGKNAIEETKDWGHRV